MEFGALFLVPKIWGQNKSTYYYISPGPHFGTFYGTFHLFQFGGHQNNSRIPFAVKKKKASDSTMYFQPFTAKITSIYILSARGPPWNNIPESTMEIFGHQLGNDKNLTNLFFYWHCLSHRSKNSDTFHWKTGCLIGILISCFLMEESPHNWVGRISSPKKIPLTTTQGPFFHCSLEGSPKVGSFAEEDQGRPNHLEDGPPLWK